MTNLSHLTYYVDQLNTTMAKSNCYSDLLHVPHCYSDLLHVPHCYSDLLHVPHIHSDLLYVSHCYITPTVELS